MWELALVLLVLTIELLALAAFVVVFLVYDLRLWILVMFARLRGFWDDRLCVPVLL